MTLSPLSAAYRGRPAIGGWVAAGGAFAYDTFRRAGYDVVGIDCQHSLLDEAAAASLIWRESSGAGATLVRVSRNDPTLIAKLADAGAEGVIVPMVDTPEDAEHAVAAARYPPQGRRSFGPIRPDLPRRDLGQLAARVRVFAMIETRLGLDNVTGIVAVEGLGGVYVGPVDLAIALGLAPDHSAEKEPLRSAIETIGEACVARGVIFGIHVPDVPTGTAWARRGAGLIVIGSDKLMLQAAAATVLEQMSAPQA